MILQKPRLPRTLDTLENTYEHLSEQDSVTKLSITNEILDSELLDRLSISESSISKTSFVGVYAEHFDITDCELKGSDLSASKFPHSGWLRVAVEGSRCTGFQVIDGTLRDVTFKNCKLDMVNFRTSKLENVVFENCMMSDVDFNDGNLKNVSFIDCTLHDVTFLHAKMVNVDISKSTIEHIKGIASIKGVAISEQQLSSLAPSLAVAAGIKLTTHS